MITIRLSGPSLEHLKRVRTGLNQRLGVHLCDTDLVRYSLRFMAQHIEAIPETIFEPKLCGDCQAALVLVTVDGVDQLQCPKCGSIDS